MKIEAPWRLFKETMPDYAMPQIFVLWADGKVSVSNKPTIEAWPQWLEVCEAAAGWQPIEYPVAPREPTQAELDEETFVRIHGEQPPHDLVEVGDATRKNYMLKKMGWFDSLARERREIASIFSVQMSHLAAHPEDKSDRMVKHFFLHQLYVRLGKPKDEDIPF